MSWPECLIILIFIIITWIGGDSQRIAAQASPDHRTLEEGQLWSEPPWFDQSDDETWQVTMAARIHFVFVFRPLEPCDWNLWLIMSALGGQPKTDRDEVWLLNICSRLDINDVQRGAWLLSLSWSKQGNCSARRKNMTNKEGRNDLLSWCLHILERRRELSHYSSCTTIVVGIYDYILWMEYSHIIWQL